MPSNSPPAITGSCMCGHVRYSSSTLPDGFTHCHCKTCRKLSGAPFLTFAGFLSSSITWTSGADSLKTSRYSDIADRTHCEQCGSPMSMQYKCESERIGITAGTIDEDSIHGKMPGVNAHIFVGEGEKAGWYDLPDDKVPKYPRFTTNFQKKLDGWKKVLTAPGLG